MADEQPEMRINRLSPILAVTDVPAAVDYYTRVLGIEKDWLWGDPPTHGAVRKDRIQIQFTLNPDLAARAEGMQYFLFVDAVEEFHALHQLNGAKIVSPIGNKPWGMREYTVRDLTGYHLRFAGEAAYERPASARDSLPANIQIVERMPTVDEFIALVKSVGWTYNADVIGEALRGSVYGVVAIDRSAANGSQTVGMLRIIGDGVSAFNLQDVAVMPSRQGQRIGSALVSAALNWIRRTAPKGAFVGLFTLRPKFYERFGFQTGTSLHLRT